MRSVVGHEQIYPIVLLQNLEDGRVLWVRWRDAQVDSLFFGALWFKCRIQLELVARRWKEVGNLLKVGKLQRWLYFAKRDERLDVCLENRALRPWPERLVDMGIDTARSDFAYKIGRGSAKCVNEEVCKDACTSARN